MADQNPKDFQKTEVTGVNSTVFGVNINEGAATGDMNNSQRGILGVVAPPADYGPTPGAIMVDDIAESTADAGVTVDGLQIKDNAIPAYDAIIAALLPVGIQVPYGGETAPSGWLLCDGSAVSRTTYADLFAVLGTKYGAGDGSTTFNVPDKRNKVSRGANLPAEAGGTGGSDSVTIAAENVPQLPVNMRIPNVSYSLNVASTVARATGTATTSSTQNIDGANKIEVNAGSANTPLDITPAYELDNFIIYAGS